MPEWVLVAVSVLLCSLCIGVAVGRWFKRMGE